MTYDEASRMLSSDPRFTHPSLNFRDKQRLFTEHISRLSSRRSNALHSLFAANAELSTAYPDVYPKIIDDPVVKQLGLDSDALEVRYNVWRRARESEARTEFDQMLGENSFVEFWGRMRKKEQDENALGLGKDEAEDGEGMGEGGVADLTALAKQIDLNEIKSVLRVSDPWPAVADYQRDKRYRQFDHMPEAREQWLRVS